MHCPSCGATAVSDQKFCRACGFGLEQVARLIAERSPDENFESAPDSSKERSKGLSHWFSLFMTFISDCVIGAAPPDSIRPLPARGDEPVPALRRLYADHRASSHWR